MSLDDEPSTPLGEFSRRVAQYRCPACDAITLLSRCPDCGQMIPRTWTAPEPLPLPPGTRPLRRPERSWKPSDPVWPGPDVTDRDDAGGK